MSLRARRRQPGRVFALRTAMFEGMAKRSIHGPGATPWRNARLTRRPFAARWSSPARRLVPDAYSFASTGSPAARRRSMSAETARRHSSNSRRLSNAATTT
jgi:hypothetical protein